MIENIRMNSGFWGYKVLKKNWKLNSGQRFQKSAFRLWEENEFANLLVIHASVHIDTLKAKTAVQNLEFRRKLKAEWPEGTLTLHGLGLI